MQLRLLSQGGAAALAMLHWLGMVLVMVPLFAAPELRFVAARSFAQRRGRSVALFLLPVLSFWSLAGLVPIAVLLTQEWSDRRRILASCAILLVAALWQLTPHKQAALQACHRTAPLAPTGWRADVDCLRHGCRYGACCIASCWALMFSCVLAEHQWAVVAVTWWVGLNERAATGPNRGSHALALAGCAGLVVLPLVHLFRYG